MSKIVKINSKKSIVTLDKDDLSSYDLIKWVRTSSLGIGHRCFIDEQPFEKVAAQIHKEKYPSDQVKVAEAVVKNHDGTIDVFLKVTATYAENMYKKDPTKLVFAGPQDAEIIKEINSDVSKTAFSNVSEDDYYRLDKEAYTPYGQAPTAGNPANGSNPAPKADSDEEFEKEMNAPNTEQVDPNKVGSVKKAFNFDKKEKYDEEEDEKDEDDNDEDDDKEIKDNVDEHENEEELEEDIEEDKEEGDDKEDLEADEKALKEIEESEGNEEEDESNNMFSAEENEDESEFKAELQKFIDEKGIDSLIQAIPEEELNEMKSLLGMGSSCDSCGVEEIENDIPHLPPLKTMDLNEMSDEKPMVIEFGEGEDPFESLFKKHLKPEVEEHGLGMVAAIVSVMLKK